MMTLNQALVRLAGKPDKPALERYIAYAWLKPLKVSEQWSFEEIDLARAQLIYHLTRDVEIEDHAVSLMLGLLDQVYTMQEQMRLLKSAIERQPETIQDDIRSWLREPYASA